VQAVVDRGRTLDDLDALNLHRIYYVGVDVAVGVAAVVDGMPSTVISTCPP
jgi:hypothetical protein